MTDKIDHRAGALDALARASSSDQTMSAERFNLDAAQVHALLDIAQAIREAGKPRTVQVTQTMTATELQDWSDAVRNELDILERAES